MNTEKNCKSLLKINNSLLFNNNGLLIFINIQNYNFALQLSKALNITYSAIEKNLFILIEEELITVQKEGRKNILYYTKKGLKILTELNIIDTLYSEKSES